MYCTNCGKKIIETEKFCTNCGKSTSIKDSVSNDTDKKMHSPLTSHKKFLSIPKLIGAVVFVVLIVWGIYANSQDDAARQSNDQALVNFSNGNNQLATQQLQNASKTASDSNIKLGALINLAYVYESDGKDNQALVTFKQALQIAQYGTSDYYLVSGEIALLQNDADSAYADFTKANQISPNDYQIINSLGLLYLDLDNSSKKYENYPKALSLLQSAYNLAKPDNIEIAKQNLAIAYYFNENYNQTISLLSSENFNNFPYSAYWIGLAYAQNNDQVNARFYLQKAVDLGVPVPQEVTNYINSN
jgi:tetratricopeptide (TPR) repeat protein